MLEASQASHGDASFLRELVRQLRAQEASGAWDGKSDREVLAPYVVGRDRDRRRGEDELDPDVYLRIELFYSAVGQAIEARTGVPCTAMLKMQHEGFGRVVLLAGRLVAVSKFLRDVHRFGFDSLEKLAEAGEKLVEAGVAMIETFPEAARHGG